MAKRKGQKTKNPNNPTPPGQLPVKVPVQTTQAQTLVTLAQEGESVISVEAWRNSRAKLYQLPSGNTVRLKRIGLLDLVVQGDIPDTLGPLVNDFMDGKVNPGELSLDRLKDYSELINSVCIACFVEPPLAETPSQTHLGVSEVDYVDRVNVFLWANDGARKLEPFRQE